MRQKQHTKDEIARIAFALFSKHGYHRVSVDMIAEAAAISRATFFNYFSQKELLLDELAAVRARRIKEIFAGFRAGGKDFTLDSLIGLLLDVCAENARISLMSKKLLLEAVFNQMTRGSFLTARDYVIAALCEVLSAIPGYRKSAKHIAETVFSVFFSTMLEWLMREDVSESWLVKTMQTRLEVLMKGVR